MKHIDRKDFPEWIVKNPEIAEKIAGDKYLCRSLDYIVNREHHTLDHLLAAFDKVSPQLKETMPTNAQKISNEDIHETIRRTIININKVGIDPSLIARGKHTPTEEVNRTLGA